MPTATCCSAGGIPDALPAAQGSPGRDRGHGAEPVKAAVIEVIASSLDPELTTAQGIVEQHAGTGEALSRPDRVVAAGLIKVAINPSRQMFQPDT